LLSRRESCALTARQNHTSRRSEGSCPNSPAAADHREECWHIYYFGDVHVGTIAERVGNPHDTDPWEWNCGSYPGSEPGEISSETAATLKQTRADFERRCFFRNEPKPIFGSVSV
jgi:hypothetical protein